ncbi:hypothetical protein RFI_04085, partial [Reticulomyxa filosa]
AIRTPMSPASSSSESQRFAVFKDIDNAPTANIPTTVPLPPSATAADSKVRDDKKVTGNEIHPSSSSMLTQGNRRLSKSHVVDEHVKAFLRDLKKEICDYVRKQLNKQPAFQNRMNYDKDKYKTIARNVTHQMFSDYRVLYKNELIQQRSKFTFDVFLTSDRKKHIANLISEERDKNIKQNQKIMDSVVCTIFILDSYSLSQLIFCLICMICKHK